MSSVRRTLKGVITAILLRLYPKRDLNGLRVVFTDLEMDRDVALQRLDEAVSLLAHTDTRMHGQLSRYVRDVFVWAGHYSAAMPPRSIQLCSAHVMDSTALELASVLVHETIHLRIARHGIRYEGILQERIERRCIREQASFLRKQGDEGISMAEVFEHALNTPWWTDEAHQEDIERLITDAGIPRWMIPVMGGRIRSD